MQKRRTILEQLIQPGQGDLSEALAEFLLTLDFPQCDHDRYQELSEKAQEGTLSGEEKIELEEFLNVNDFLATVQAKARKSLTKPATSVA